MTDLSTAINAINASTADLRATIPHRGTSYMTLPLTIGGIDCGTVEIEAKLTRGERGFYGEGDAPSADLYAVLVGKVDILPSLKPDDVRALEAEVVERAS